MSTSKSTILFVSLGLVLFIIGLTFYSDFIQWFLIRRDNVVYQTYPISGQFQHSLLFALYLAAIPLIALLIGKTWRQKITALGFITLCVAGALLVRKFLLLLTINKLPEKAGETMQYPIPLHSLELNAVMTIGLLIGSATMLLFFKFQHKLSRAAADRVLPE